MKNIQTIISSYRKIKIAYENLNTKENFYDFLKSFSNTRNSLDLYSSLNKDLSTNK